MAQHTTKRPVPPGPVPPALPLADMAGADSMVRNVKIGGERTSVRMNGLAWRALDEMCRREGWNRNDVATWVAAYRPENMALTDALRAVALSYWARRAGLDLAAGAPVGG